MVNENNIAKLKEVVELTISELDKNKIGNNIDIYNKKIRVIDILLHAITLIEEIGEKWKLIYFSAISLIFE